MVYLLAAAMGSLYTGSRTNLARRLAAHRAERECLHALAWPVRLVYESSADRGAALRREAAIKRLTRQAKLELIGR